MTDLGAAPARAERDGLGALDARDRALVLVSEAEVLTDREGVDAFVRRYLPGWGDEVATAFAALGAHRIAAAVEAVLHGGPTGDLGVLLADRSGYSADDVARVGAATSGRRPSTADGALRRPQV